MDALRTRAERWLADDPDPTSQAELRAVIDGLPDTADELADRFAGPLTFGTAGLRGRMRAGPNGMNLAVVRQAAAGLVAWLAERDPDRPLVIGYDARRGSRAFAEETARVATGAGRRALVLPRRAAHAGTGARGARARRVRRGDGHREPQPAAGQRLQGLPGRRPRRPGRRRAPRSCRRPTPRSRPRSARSVRWRRYGWATISPHSDESVVKSYMDGAVAVLDPSIVDDEYRSELTVAYTAMHGVGAPGADRRLHPGRLRRRR